MVGNNHIIINFMQHFEEPTRHLDVLGKTVLGPVILPDMQWAKILDHLMPKLLSATVPLSLQLPPFSQVKRSWSEAFATKYITMLNTSSVLASIVVQREKCSPRRRSVVANLESGMDESSQLVQFSANSVTVRSKRGRKATVPLVQSPERRFTRSCLNQKGYRPTPVMATPPMKKRKGRAKMLVVQSEETAGTATNSQQQHNSSAGQEEVQRTLETPIHVLQQIGHQLGIQMSKLTKELLEAAPGPDDHARKDDD
jgi:hypothetical protein